ncbi:MAG: class I SAM-dependent methyltransferase [Anaerolineales bacterium]
MSKFVRATLKSGKEKSVQRCHPWVFANAIERIDGEVEAGEAVEVFSHQGEWLAWGVISPWSQIRLRLWSWDRSLAIDQSLLRDRLKKALKLRETVLCSARTNCMRLVHAESDGLPGLIVDRYDDYLVVQFLSWGVERRKDQIVQELFSLTNCSNIYERSDGEVRKLEGLDERSGVLMGKEPPEVVNVIENGIQYAVDLRKGHKTGFYLDQKENRLRVMKYSKGKEVLDCFSYTGGMTLPALIGGSPQVTCIDESMAAHELLKRNLALNRIPADKVCLECGDVFQLLRQYRDRGRTFDLIILDPPKFAPTVAHVSKASRGYKDINLLALKLLKQEGILITFSCSGGVSLDLFKKIVHGAALDAKRNVKIIEHLHQASDHPIDLSFPEGEYLKGLILMVD